MLDWRSFQSEKKNLFYCWINLLFLQILKPWQTMFRITWPFNFKIGSRRKKKQRSGRREENNVEFKKNFIRMNLKDIRRVFSNSGSSCSFTLPPFFVLLKTLLLLLPHIFFFALPRLCRFLSFLVFLLFFALAVHRVSPCFNYSTTLLFFLWACSMHVLSGWGNVGSFDDDVEIAFGELNWVCTVVVIIIILDIKTEEEKKIKAEG